MPKKSPQDKIRSRKRLDKLATTKKIKGKRSFLTTKGKIEDKRAKLAKERKAAAKKKAKVDIIAKASTTAPKPKKNSKSIGMTPAYSPSGKAYKGKEKEAAKQKATVKANMEASGVQGYGLTKNQKKILGDKILKKKQKAKNSNYDAGMSRMSGGYNAGMSKMPKSQMDAIKKKLKK